MEFNQPHIIDAYLRDELSGKELAAFEERMTGDPAFRNEILFQKQVVQGIADFRKSQLKARLNAIEVSPGWWQAGPGRSALIKAAGAVITAALVGTAVYYFDREKVAVEAVEEMAALKISAPEEREALPLIEIEQKAVEAIDRTTSAPAEVKIEKPVAHIAESVPDKADIPAIPEKTHETGKTMPFNPEVNLPNPGGVSGGEGFDPEEVTIPGVAAGVQKSEPIDVRTIARRSEVIKYKYYDGKLHLYGDFKAQPYEILEINSSESRKVFLYYQYKYFELKLTDKVIELPEITDPELLEELKIARNSQVD